MTRHGHWTNTIVKRCLDAIWPPVCPSCDGAVAEHGAFCADCWNSLRLISAPQCKACGIPFAYDPGQGVLCGECTRRSPPYDRARAAVAYDPNSKGMILAFKHGDRTDLVSPLSRAMIRVANPLLSDADIILPVPLHWRRRLKRRYNQSALLARRLSGHSGVMYRVGVLERYKASPSQGRETATARQRNVRGAFRVRPKYRQLLRDKRVLLVDDVMTTGATVEACSRALLRAGAGAVDVITIARVIREGL